MMVGVLVAVVLFGLVFAASVSLRRRGEDFEYAQRKMLIQEMREDNDNRSPEYFLDVSGVRRAADGAGGWFDQRLDEILQRFAGTAVGSGNQGGGATGD